MIKNLRHVGIVVQDLETCSQFFIDSLGFRIQKKALENGPFIDAILALKGTQVTTVKMLAPDNSMVELLKFHSHPDPNKTWMGNLHSTGLTHLAFTVENLDELYSKLVDQGVEFNCPPEISVDGRAKVTFCKGPENLFLELVEVVEP